MHGPAHTQEGHSAALGGPDPVVETVNGTVLGKMIGHPGSQVSMFCGIPYAMPPVGPLRWRPPVPAAAWGGVRDCTRMPPSTPQAIGKLQLRLDIPQSEDCLTLNVLTPARDPDAGLPVMVWLHGGAFIHGNGNEPFLNSEELPSHGIVLVNVNMRVGPIGLLAHSLLRDESDHGASGNYMLLDIVAALRWVRDNIALFGGSPDNVTIFGESGGGGKVLSMMCSREASGLFHKAIVQSGGVLGTLNGRSSAENEALGHAMFETLGVADAPDPLAAARALPWQAIIDADRALVEERNLTITRWNTTIDGWLLTESTAELIRSGNAPNWVPLIAGCNLGEIDGTGVPYITYPSLVEANRNAALGAREAGHPSYVYVFDRVPPGWRKDGCVSFHRLEPGYVFGDWEDRNGFFTNDALSLARASGARQDAPELNEGDRRVSQAMMQLWTSFARSGVPRSDGTSSWPLYGDTDEYLFIVDPPEVRQGFSGLVDPKVSP